MHHSAKIKAVQHKGGRCLLCGYNRCLRALHFHHINAFEKSFNISSKNSWTKIEQELDKCVLLCSNCHNEIESGIIDLGIFELLKD